MIPKFEVTYDRSQGRSVRGPYLNGAVMLAGGVAAHVAGVAAARASLHLHAGRPYQEVGRRGVHLAPGDLVDHRPRLAQRRDRLLHWEGRETGAGKSQAGAP